jgi:hypothetical protein
VSVVAETNHRLPNIHAYNTQANNDDIVQADNTQAYLEFWRISQTGRKPTSKPTQMPTNEPTTASPTTESPTTDSPTIALQQLSLPHASQR